MQVEYERCCGIDVHKETVVACVIAPRAEGNPLKATRTFSTMMGELKALAQWLMEDEVTHVAMESTGVYWKQRKRRQAQEWGRMRKGSVWLRRALVEAAHGDGANQRPVFQEFAPSLGRAARQETRHRCGQSQSVGDGILHDHAWSGLPRPGRELL